MIKNKVIDIKIIFKHIKNKLKITLFNFYFTKHYRIVFKNYY